MSDKKQKIWHIRLHHMIDAIENIKNFVSDYNDEEDFHHDLKTIAAVERQFQILGDASKNIPDDIKQKYDDIEWRKIKEMRNFVVHEYDDIEHDILWSTIQNQLPTLHDKLQKLKDTINDQNQ